MYANAIPLLRKVQERIMAEPIASLVKLRPEDAAAFPGYMQIHIDRVAAHLLGLTEKERERLFFVSDWPTEFRNDYEKSDSKEERAAIACRRIDHFINTNGRE